MMTLLVAAQRKDFHFDITPTSSTPKVITCGNAPGLAREDFKFYTVLGGHFDVKSELGDKWIVTFPWKDKIITVEWFLQYTLCGPTLNWFRAWYRQSNRQEFIDVITFLGTDCI